ncbi:hypothetical protein P9112_010415 [Eukaryota sp. TZLM1-RC]
MEVLEAVSGIVTSFEVAQHIQRRRHRRRRGQTRKALEPLNVVHTEEQLADFLALHFYLTEDNVKQLITRLQDANLTRFEIANILNELPSSIPHLVRIIEECEERYNDDETEAILLLLQQYLYEPLAEAVQKARNGE